MTHFRILVCAVIGLLLTIGVARAQGSAEYNCVVSRSYSLESGELAGWSLANTVKGVQFRVARQTGRMDGGAGFSSTVWVSKVLDYGSSEQSFKVLYTSSGGFMHVRLLQILEHRAGRTKDFIFADGDTVHTGHCSFAR